MPNFKRGKRSSEKFTQAERERNVLPEAVLTDSPREPEDDFRTVITHGLGRELRVWKSNGSPVLRRSIGRGSEIRSLVAGTRSVTSLGCLSSSNGRPVLRRSIGRGSAIRSLVAGAIRVERSNSGEVRDPRGSSNK